MTGGLEDDTDSVNDAAKNDSQAATDDISTVTGDDSTEESTRGQDRDDERGVRTGECRGIWAFDEPDEDCRSSDTVDISTVVACCRQRQS